ncbi:transcription initiation factor TFII-D component, putative [Ixodes scapularis]|uniref:Transcription initiation factor TFII-D component, putative n=1 Tax=Ixodes scapularis TaxID=6945 RepID=B7QAZ8_IXOSC|nr:transcription initiation factor TFII-D component, putative [Ixodes scapularis]|eukprot:XP_002412724.1 transcription initiation factor TFII-D component, putative [Ixodes scapularis]
MSAAKSTPKDAQVMGAILKDMGITEYEPRVINQMLEFTYRYVTNILDDARLFSAHAKKRVVDVDDVRLAIQMQADKSFTSPPPRDLLMEIARQKNSTPLPLIKANAGPRLPPDRYSLTACNYRFKSAKKPRIQVGLPTQLSLSSMQGNSGSGEFSTAVSSGTAVSSVTPVSSAAQVAAMSTVLVTSASSVTAPTLTPVGGVGPPSAVTTSAMGTGLQTGMLPVDNIKSENADADQKRKREDDDYDTDRE